MEGAHRRHAGPIPNVSKGPPRRWEVPTRCLQGPTISGVPKGPARRREAPTAVSRRLASASKGPYPASEAPQRVRSGPRPPRGRETERRAEGGLRVCGGGRDSPTGRRRSAEPLLQGAGGRERSQHVRSWGVGRRARARKASRRREEAALSGSAQARASGDGTNAHRGGKPPPGRTNCVRRGVPSDHEAAVVLSRCSRSVLVRCIICYHFERN